MACSTCSATTTRRMPGESGCTPASRSYSMPSTTPSNHDPEGTRGRETPAPLLVREGDNWETPRTPGRDFAPAPLGEGEGIFGGHPQTPGRETPAPPFFGPSAGPARAPPAPFPP